MVVFVAIPAGGAVVPTTYSTSPRADEYRIGGAYSHTEYTMDPKNLLQTVPPLAELIPANPQDGDAAKADESDVSTMETFRAAQRAGLFDFWDDPREDIYSLEDGDPL